MSSGQRAGLVAAALLVAAAAIAAGILYRASTWQAVPSEAVSRAASETGGPVVSADEPTGTEGSTPVVATALPTATATFGLEWAALYPTLILPDYPTPEPTTLTPTSSLTPTATHTSTPSVTPTPTVTFTPTLTLSPVWSATPTRMAVRPGWPAAYPDLSASKLSVHRIGTSDSAVDDFVRLVHPRLIKSVDSLGWLGEVRGISPGTVVIG